MMEQTVCKCRKHGAKITLYTVDNRLTQDIICRLQNKVQDELVRVQPGFKSELLTSVEVFQKDVTDFGTSYDTVSIMMLSEVKEGDDTVLKLFP